MRLIPGFPTNARVPYCSTCGKGPGKTVPNSPISPDRPVLDLDLDIEFEGHVVICQDCGTEIGGLVGMISEEEAERLREVARKAVEDAERLEVERDSARKAYDALAADKAIRAA